MSTLRSFLGPINYYQKFLPNLLDVLYPLHNLLQKDVRWAWSTDCQKSFDKVKSMISTECSGSLRLQASTPHRSVYGLGAVLSHCLPDGSEKPIAFASQTLSKSERNYAQIDKEALSIIFGIMRFHMYVYGRKFILRTDHKPLMTILGPKKGIPPIAAMRMQRWATRLGAYIYDIKYRSSGEHSNADALSRLPQPNIIDGTTVDLSDVFQLEQLEPLPVTAEVVRKHTANDLTLQKVFSLLVNGHTERDTNITLQPYCRILNELSLNQGCIMRGHRVLIKLSVVMHHEHRVLIKPSGSNPA